MTGESDIGTGIPLARRRGGAIALGLATILALGTIAYRAVQTEAARPQAASATDADPSIEQLRQRASRNEATSSDWQALGFAHFRQGEFAEATRAYEEAVARAGDTADAAILWSALGEARVMASRRDPMPPDALEAFRKAIALDPHDPRARYFLNVQKDLEGDHQGAIAGWLELLADTPAGAPWEADLVRTIEQVGKINAIDVGQRIAAALDARPPAPVTEQIPGPGPQEVASAGALSPTQQREMALGMVERLEQRLAADPDNIEGWVMLMRSRMALGQPDMARAALDAAIAANPGQSARLQEAARTLGVS